jgi:hypothetical protein
MKPHEISIMINNGAVDLVRNKLKKYSITERMKVLQTAIPYINSTPKILEFFKNNFAKEIGAIILANGDLKKATNLYNLAKPKSKAIRR